MSGEGVTFRSGGSSELTQEEQTIIEETKRRILKHQKEKHPVGIGVLADENLGPDFVFMAVRCQQCQMVLSVFIMPTALYQLFMRAVAEFKKREGFR